MLDRASTFSNPAVLAFIKAQTIPVAIDQAYQRRQKDAEGIFYRKIAGQGPRNNFEGTTQGLYMASADGTFLGFTNTRTPKHVIEMLKQSLEKHQPRAVQAIERGKSDARYNPQPPEGGLVVRVQAKVLDGYEKTDNPHRQMMIDAISRDNLWVSKEEHQALVDGHFPERLAHRIARFHIIDNTRGEPPMWRKSEIRDLKLSLEAGVVSGHASVWTEDRQRGYQPKFLGYVETKDGVVTRFDLVAKGLFWGEGPFTRRAPKGEFPLAISFTLADGSDIADRIPPQGSRGWLPGYLQRDP